MLQFKNLLDSEPPLLIVAISQRQESIFGVAIEEVVGQADQGVGPSATPGQPGLVVRAAAHPVLRDHPWWKSLKYPKTISEALLSGAPLERRLKGSTTPRLTDFSWIVAVICS
ncbi:MAG: hypothetical protein IPK73_29960 [Candidatus Obscuribacter sp.]|nr:hypothetical protein [Candidatus Obscuribacter sp.]